MTRFARGEVGVALLVGSLVGAELVASAAPGGATVGAGGPKPTNRVILVTNNTRNDLDLTGSDKGPGDVWNPKPKGFIQAGSVNQPITSTDEGGHGCRASVVYRQTTRDCSASDICEWTMTVSLKKQTNGGFDPDSSGRVSSSRISCDRKFVKFNNRVRQVAYSLSRST